MAGLDPDEIADVERRSSAAAQGQAPQYRRAIVAIATFAVVLLPIVLGSMWLAEQLIYTPLCQSDVASEVIRVDIDLPIDGGINTSGDDGRTTCVYANGDQTAMQETISKPAAIALDWALVVVAFGLPIVFTILVARLVPLER